MIFAQSTLATPQSTLATPTWDAGVNLSTLIIGAAVSFMGWQVRGLVRKVEVSSEEVARIRLLLAGAVGQPGLAQRVETLEAAMLQREREQTRRVGQYLRWRDRVNASLFKSDPEFHSDRRRRRTDYLPDGSLSDDGDLEDGDE